MWLVRKVTVASYLYSLCLLWVRECRRLLSLRAYPASRGVLELQGSREDRWLPVVYRRRQNWMGILCKGQRFIHSFDSLCLYITGAKGPLKNALLGGQSKTFEFRCGSKLPQSWKCNGSPHASQEYAQDSFISSQTHLSDLAGAMGCPPTATAGPLILILSIYSRLSLREGLKPDKHPAR